MTKLMHNVMYILHNIIYNHVVFTITIHCVTLHLMLVACLCRKGSDDKIEMTTEDNPAYGLSGPQRRETKDEYEYIQSSAAAPQEAVYEGV